MKTIRTSLISAVAFAALFSLCGLICNFGDWNRLKAYATIGATLGLLAAPEFEPKVFPYPVLWQSFWGGACAFLIAVSLDSSTEAVRLATLVGTIIGMTAKLWLKHIPLA
jgi:hypothetical protein